MRKLLLTSVCLLLGVMSTWATDFFTPKTSADYPDEKVYYVTLTISDPHTTKTHDVVELAAFIGEECRAHATEKVNGVYALRVVGDLAADKDKPITFKAFCEGLIYEFTTLGTFSSADAEFIELTLDLLTRITMKGTINITAPTLPTTYNAREDVYVMFGGWYDYSPNVFLESQLTWSMSGNTALNNYIDSIASEPGEISQDVVVPNPILTTTAIEGTTKLNLHLTGPQYDGFEQFTLKSYNTAMVNISLAVMPVTSITLNPTSLTVNVGENIFDRLAEVGITVLPEDATDKTTHWDFGNTTDWFGANDSIVTTYGDYTVTCVSTSNPSVTVDLSVHVPQPVSFNFTKEVTMDIRNSATVNFTNLVGENFDASLISVTAPWNANNGDSPFKATVAQDGLSCTIFGKYAGNHEFRVTYDGRTMTAAGDNATSGTVHVNGLMTLPGNGWKWVSATYFDANMAPLSVKKQDQSLQDFMAYVVEMRTQDNLLYNDSEKGLFGYITELAPSAGMYKVRGKGDAANVIQMGSDAVVASSAVWNQMPLRKGYNWVTYPQEYDLELSELPNFATPEDGDMIIGQTTSAVYDVTNGQWVGAGFKFEAGKGYMYYTTADNPMALDFFFTGTPICYQNQPSNAPRKKSKHGWTLKNEGFVNNMPVFVRIEGLTDADHYLIGAFVDGECRGEGSVAVDDVMLLNVAGNAGETVSLRLFDKVTGQEYLLDQTIRHASMIGSLRVPMTISSPVLTGISNISAVKTDQQHIFSISGQQLSAPRKGINIIDGKKVVR